MNRIFLTGLQVVFFETSWQWGPSNETTLTSKDAMNTMIKTESKPGSTQRRSTLRQASKGTPYKERVAYRVYSLGWEIQLQAFSIMMGNAVSPHGKFLKNYITNVGYG